jgi:phage-related tail protein
LRSVGRQRYYSAIVREAAARRALDDCSSEEGVLVLEPSLYEDIGKKSLAAFTNLLDALSGARVAAVSGQRDVSNDQALQQQLSSLVEALEGVRRDLGAFVNRTDRMLLELSRRLDAAERRSAGLQSAEAADTTGTSGSAAAAAVIRAAQDGTLPAGTPATGRSGGRQQRRGEYKRVPKEQTLGLILEAARELAAQGRKVTLAECARHADVAYYKAVYACKDSDELAQLMA